MNTADRWVRSCLGKKRYSSHELAAKLVKRAKEERGTELRIYTCPTCCGYHLTKQKLAATIKAN